MFPSDLSPTLPPGTQPLSVKKRKRDDTAIISQPNELDSRPFLVRPAQGEDLTAKARSFTPLCLLRRERLPLALLDAESRGGRLFTAHVGALEVLCENGEEGWVLAAQEGGDGRFFAFERAGKRVYALCRLGEGVTREGLGLLAGGSGELGRAGKRRVVECKGAGTGPWWAKAAVEVPQQVTGGSVERPGLRLEVREDVLEDTSVKNSDRKLEHTAHAMESQEADAQAGDTGPHDSPEELAKQYLDALYLSRTSLAYFAKGPLSRARTTFTSGNATPAQCAELVDFFRNTILPANVMDKKFKDSLNGLIKDLPLVTPSQSRRKKKFKPKRDKSGLFTNEHDYLEQWWRGEELPGSMISPENLDTALRRRLPGLRTRETYLQIIIILETLYLETIHKSAAGEMPVVASETQDAETQDVESQATAGATKRKGKKPQDLHSLLETLLDRLCIWQDLEAHTPAKSLSKSEAKGDEPGNELREFCIEIIVPFFMSRLPKEAALVNKKLGGPSPPSPEKRKSTSSRSKPGEPAVRSRPEKQPRKPLTRVATESLNHTARRAPGLYRSATDTAIIKREDSQPALSSIPPAKPRARESALNSYLPGRRQVDLDAKSAAATERLRKKRETDAQVQEAIANARKPNRSTATKDVAARADEKFSQNLPGWKPTARRPQQSVAVAATPKRSKSGYNNTVYSHSFVPQSEAHSSNPSVIPSSSARYRGAPPAAPCVESTPYAHKASARTSDVGAGVAETPSRSVSKFALVGASPSERQTAPAGLLESPSARRTIFGVPSGGGVAATPLKGLGRRGSFGVGETPVMGSLRGLVGGTPVRGGRGADVGDVGDGGGDEGGGGGSIYDVWNDDYEELA